MFAVDEETAAAIRRMFHEEGEFAAVVELRRRCRGIGDNAVAWCCVRTIAGWSPPPPPPVKPVVPSVVQFPKRRPAEP
jgi:hypothetical protein